MAATKPQRVLLDLSADDAEPILRQAAEQAAKYSAWCDYITRRTVQSPFSDWRASDGFTKAQAEWRERFLAAKRMVEAFGVEYEATSEEETLTVYWPDKVLKSHVVDLGSGFKVRHIDKSVPDPKNAMPEYRRGVHQEACRQAAERVVRRWRGQIAGSACAAAAAAAE